MKYSNLQIAGQILFLLIITSFIVGLFHYDSKFSNFLGGMMCILLIGTIYQAEKEKKHLHIVVYSIPLLISIIYFFFIKHF